jgi:hypothetical protein
MLIRFGFISGLAVGLEVFWGDEATHVDILLGIVVINIVW